MFTSKSRRDYIKTLMTLPLSWVKDSAANPSPSMTPMCVILHRIVLRRRGVFA